ncbi:hypothetical protein HDU76_009921 [Blyttiomyces sp. JEL0837]|nr:hypothetical protein HDU76_009921 [Blyttiomyces sp. JEL0837]
MSADHVVAARPAETGNDHNNDIQKNNNSPPQLPPRQPDHTQNFPHRRIALVIQANRFLLLPIPGEYQGTVGHQPVGSIESTQRLQDPVPKDADGAVVEFEHGELEVIKGREQALKELEMDETSIAFDIFGVVGIIEVASGPHLIVIVRRRYLGSLLGKAIYRLEKVAILPMSSTEALRIMTLCASPPTFDPDKLPEEPPSLIPDDPLDDEELANSLTLAENGRSESPSPTPPHPAQSTSSDAISLSPSRNPNTPGTPATPPRRTSSPSTSTTPPPRPRSDGVPTPTSDDDLNQSMQRRAEAKDSDSWTGAPFWLRADRRFFWNEYVSLHLVESKLHKFVLPIMQGFVQVQTNCAIDEARFDFALISRRSKERAGLRYERRGADHDGNVANFVETEMVISAESLGITHYAAFVQIRGSIPLLWKQVPAPNVLNPPPILEDTDEVNAQIVDRHFSALESVYKSIIVIDLVEQKGREAPLGTRYRQMLAHIRETQHPTLQYRDFDFHSQCKGNRYDKVKNLLLMLESEFSGTVQ